MVDRFTYPYKNMHGKPPQFVWFTFLFQVLNHFEGNLLLSIHSGGVVKPSLMKKKEKKILQITIYEMIFCHDLFLGRSFFFHYDDIVHFQPEIYDNGFSFLLLMKSFNPEYTIISVRDNKCVFCCYFFFERSPSVNIYLQVTYSGRNVVCCSSFPSSF